MKVFNDIQAVSKSLLPTAAGLTLAIGNFDGVHLGHREVIRACVKAAAAAGGTAAAAAGVMSFEPPPNAFFHPQKKQYRLTQPTTKQNLIAQLEVDFLLNLKFDETLAAMEPEEFISSILEERLNAKYIVVGKNFRFGKKRQGDVALLKEKASVPVEIIPSFSLGGEVVSSTNIRAALKQGKIKQATTLLGRWFHLSGEVVEGQKLGRKLGFPTLNIELKNYTDLAYGVYAVRCWTATAAPTATAATATAAAGQWFDGVASIGLRPTIGDLEQPLLEVYLFNTDQNLYGTHVDVFLLDFLREEIKFDDLDNLKAQMAQDTTLAQSRLLELKKLDYPYQHHNKNHD